MSVSVALAAKDGARYLQEQVASILPQLAEHNGDELVISTDPSSDATVEIAAALSKETVVVKHVMGPGEGVIKNFECALNRCKGSHVFLCDQDDIWMPDKVSKVMHCFEKSGAALILHDALVVDENLQVLASSYFEKRGVRQGFWSNIFRNSFVGCCMAFKREVLDKTLPMPLHIPMHDQWIGILAAKHMQVEILPLQLIQYRRHGTTATASNHAGVVQMLAWRLQLVRALLKRERELR